MHYPTKTGTLDVFQPTRPAPLKADVLASMKSMSVTRPVSQPVSGWLKTVAPANVFDKE